MCMKKPNIKDSILFFDIIMYIQDQEHPRKSFKYYLTINAS